MDPYIKTVISGEIFHACCDIISEFCLMPKAIYESLNLWGLSEGGEEISLTNSTTILPIGVAEGVFTKFSGRTMSTDYLVIECVGEGQITLGRSLLKLLGAVIDVGKGTLNFSTTLGCGRVFPIPKRKGKISKVMAVDIDLNASSLENT